MAGLLCLVCATAGAETMRLRIAWGGGTEYLWRGAIAVRDGTLSEPQPLGLEADESGSMWLDGGRLNVVERSPHGYDGVDVSVDAPLRATLLVYLTAAPDDGRPTWIEVPLADVVQREYNADLDKTGNRLSVRRTPGDSLHVRLDQRCLVFAPGEVLGGQVEPHSLPMDPGSKVRLTLRLIPARSTNDLWSVEHPLGNRSANEFWTEEHTFVAGDGASIPLKVPLPKQEGVYDLVIQATHAGMIPWPQPDRAARMLKQPLVERRVQLVVLATDRTPRSRAESLREVVEIDPANPKWWERFATLPQLAKLSRMWKGPLSHGRLASRKLAVGEVAQLAPSPKNGEASWEAYTLPINRTGLPHILEVDYPSDVPQTLGISIIEPNGAGAVVPIGLDSGIDQTETVVRDARPPEWLRHRIIFWPQTKAPIVLISNRRSDKPGMYGKIRVLDGWEHLPPAFAAEEGPPARLWAGYMDRPLIPENFGATEAPDSPSELSVDDWRTFYEGGTRLVEYLNHVGHSGLMLSVLADGSTIYPSKLVVATPRYDTGAFLATGQDPVRKDVLEMLFRLFDREGLQLIPALEFSSPLPELEAIVRAGGPASEGVQWVGADGRLWQQVHPPVQGMAPYYNLLNPQVQESMLAVIREVITRYAGHGSFTGLAVQLSGEGYAQLPGPGWGMDDATIAQFERDTRIDVPGRGPGRFGQRAQFLTGAGSQAWLQWRGAQVARFYGRVRDELQAARPGACVYLAGAHFFSGEERAAELMPVLPQRMSLSEVMLRAGIDVQQYRRQAGLVLLRSETMVPEWSLTDLAVNQELSQMPDWDRLFQGLPKTGSLFFQKPQEVRLASFDEKSPYRPTYTWLATQPVPSGIQNRRRFAHALAALDVRAIFDGGWELSMGQEGTLKDLIAIYRWLPAVAFEPVGDLAESQPVAVRVATHENRTWVYAVNDAPFASELRVRVTAPAGCQMEDLSGTRRTTSLARDAEGTYWTVALGAYEMAAVRFSAPEVKLYDPKVTWPGAVYASLQKQIAELGDRAVALRSPPLLAALANGDFEQAGGAQEAIPGWLTSEGTGVVVGSSTSDKHSGSRSVRMSSNGTVVSLVSQPFESPRTGRLSLSVWLRTTDAAVQPQLSVAVEGRYRGMGFYRSAPAGRSGQAGKAVPPIPAQWKQFVVPINDLPLEGLSPLQVRFDLIGPGEVWIDDVRLSSLVFSDSERLELARLIAPADAKLQRGHVSDCMRLLESYWPRFLVNNVPLSEMPISRKSEPAAQPTTSPQEIPAKGFLGRMKEILPEKLRF